MKFSVGRLEAWRNPCRRSPAQDVAVCPVWRRTILNQEISHMRNNSWQIILIVLAVIGGIVLISAIGMSLMHGGIMGGMMGG